MDLQKQQITTLGKKRKQTGRQYEKANPIKHH